MSAPKTPTSGYKLQVVKLKEELENARRDYRQEVFTRSNEMTKAQQFSDQLSAARLENARLKKELAVAGLSSGGNSKNLGVNEDTNNSKTAFPTPAQPTKNDDSPTGTADGDNMIGRRKRAQSRPDLE